MANYTEEDKRAFKLKDQLNSRMSALKAASINNEGKGISAEDMLGEANKYYAWLYPDEKGVTSDVSLPTPTAAQQKVLDEIEKQLNLSNAAERHAMHKKVLDFAEKNFKMRKYPESMDSVNVFVQNIK